MKLYLPFGVLFISTFFELQGQLKPSNLSFVDPTIGTVGVVLGPALPTVHLPNSMIRVFPVRKDHLDDQISYFPLTSPSHRLSTVFAIMPVTGDINESIWTRKFEYSKEKITPYYYSSTLEESENLIEFSPMERSGFFRFSFPFSKDHYLRLGLINKSGEITVEGKRVITGREEFSGMNAFFYAELDTDITGIPYRDSTKQILIKLDIKKNTVSFKYGLSFISIEQARQNLHKEIPHWNFDAIKNHAYNTWDKALSQVQVEGGTNAQKRVFYTALYRCYERMVDINEYGRYYSSYDNHIHESSDPFYVDSWTYDFAIGLFPLQMILNPERQADFINSYISMYDQGGWMPSFALINGDWPAMTGNYAAVWMADAWFKGIRNFDVRKAYEGLKKNSLQATLLPWRNGPGLTYLDSFYNKNGYMPGLKPGERETVKEVDTVWEKRQSVSVTLENSFCDWCLAQLATPAGYAEDKPLFLKRSENYKNLYRVDKGFMWPKDDKGEWIEPIDPRLAGREYYTENNAYTFNWHVKHDLENLFRMMGGRDEAEAKLDQLFREDLGLPKFRFWYTQPDASGLVGQFPMGNETSFFIPYLYNNLGKPWKTQKRIRSLLETMFPDNIFGYPGDEDGGGMSAFIVFSMMGFFPVTPGIPAYNIGSPVFNKITIQLKANKWFVIHAKNNSATNKYIQSAKLNGKLLNKSWFVHSEILKGGTLEFYMGKKPNKKWGIDDKNLPPSRLSIQPNNFIDKK